MDVVHDVERVVAEVVHPVELPKVPIEGEVCVKGRVATSEEAADFGTYRTIVLSGTEDKQIVLPQDNRRVRAYITVNTPNTAQAPVTTTVPANTHPANPAAGSDFTATVPAAQQWSLQSVDFTLTTSATVGNRQIQLIIDDGTNVLWQYLVTVTQAASLAYIYVFGGASNDTAVRTATGVNEVLSELPTISLAAGCRIRTSTVGIQAGDQFSAISLTFLRTTTTSSTTAAAVWVGSEAQCAAIRTGNTSAGGFMLMSGQILPVMHKEVVWLIPDQTNPATVSIAQEKMR